jgi:hypothetical protein
LPQEFYERGEVAVFMKDGAAAISPVEHMVAITTLGSACGAWHGGDCRGSGLEKQAKKYDVPFFSFFPPFFSSFFSLGLAGVENNNEPAS